jgi:NADPH2:quinone reductase
LTWAIRVHEFGGPEVLGWEEVSLREPRPGEVRLRHTAIGLNFVEINQRRGRFPFRLPFTPGNGAAGVVEAVGSDVSDFRPGDRVVYAPVPGSYSEARLIPAERLIPLPSELDDRTAAAAILQGMTAQYLLRQTHRVGPGDVVLVHAAAGGMGLILCQWAKMLGATVLGTVSTGAKAALARQHGCDYPILYSRDDVVREVRRITDGQMATVVYDAVGRDTIMASIDSLRPLGHLVSYGNASGPVPPLDIAMLGDKGSLSLTRATLATYTRTRAGLLDCANDVFDVLRSGAVRVTIGQTFPLREAEKAHRALEGRATTGSTLLLP